MAVAPAWHGRHVAGQTKEWHGIAWNGMEWHGVAWHGMACHGKHWHGMAWQGIGLLLLAWRWHWRGMAGNDNGTSNGVERNCTGMALARRCCRHGTAA
jgi:hypothetical protein